MLVPDDNQARYIEDILYAFDYGGSLVAEGMGRGKTLIATEVILQSKARVVLIVAPLGTRSGWVRTLLSQGYEGPIHRIVSGKTFEPVVSDLKNGVPGVYIIGIQFFRSNKFDWAKFKKIDIAVVDEIHKFSNRQGVGFSKLRKLKPKFRLGMSGTPWGNKIENMWAVTRWIFPDVVPSSFWDWAERYLVQEVQKIYVGGKEREVIKFTGEHIEGNYVRSLPSFIRTPEAHPEIPPVLYDKLYVELTPLQRRMYDVFEEEAIIWVNENPLIAKIPLVMRVRLRQMTLGSVTVSEDGVVGFPEDMKSSKIDVLKEFLDDNPENILIVTDSRRFADVVVKQLGDSARGWVGGLSEAEQGSLIEEFGVTYKHLVAVASALGEGIDGLQARCNTMVWLSRTEDPVLNAQTEARIARRGQPKDHVVCIDIVAENTMDEEIDGNNYLKKLRVEGTFK